MGQPGFAARQIHLAIFPASRARRMDAETRRARNRDTPDSNLASISRDFAYLNRGRTIEGDAPLINAAPPELKVLDDSTDSPARAP